MNRRVAERRVRGRCVSSAAAAAMLATLGVLQLQPRPSEAQALGGDAGASSPSAATAGDAGAPTEDATAGVPEERDDRSRAQLLLEEGNRLVAERDFTTALERYRAAHALYPSVKLLINIGTSLRHLGRQAEAAAAYERYLRDPGAEPARAAELRKIIAEIDTMVGWLSVETGPEPTTVRVDGRLLEGERLRRGVRLDVGRHVVEVQVAGRSSVVQTITLAARQRYTLRPPSPQPLEPTGGAQRAAAWALGTVGIAGLTVGAVFGALAVVSSAEHDAEPIPALERAAEQDATVAYVGLAAGGAALGVGIILALTAPETDLDVAVSAGPVPGELARARLELRW